MTVTKATARATKVEQTRDGKGYIVTFNVVGNSVPPQQIRVDVPGRIGMNVGEAENVARRTLENFCRDIAPSTVAAPLVRPRMTLPPKDGDDRK